MELEPLYKRVVGLDVHQAQITACAILERDDGTSRVEHRQFGSFKRDRRALAEWVVEVGAQEVIMESTGIYWKSPYAALEAVGIQAKVVNARHVKTVPGRKTDIGDAQWLAILGRSGLLRGSFIPPARFRDLRMLSRQRQKLTSQLSSEKNRLNKVLTDAGIRLGVVVSDLHGKAARAMTKGLIAGEPPELVVTYAGNRLQASQEEILDALQGDLNDVNRFILRELVANIEATEAQIERFDRKLLIELKPESGLLDLLETMPGVERIGAAMLLVEIGTDMGVFGSADRLASWVAVCPGNHESAGKRTSGRIRQGNRHVRRLLVEFAHAASRTRSALRQKFDSLLPRRGYKRAIIALGHKILRIIYRLLERREPYRDSAMDYEAIHVQRNAPRWLKALIKHGYITPATA